MSRALGFKRGLPHTANGFFAKIGGVVLVDSLNKMLHHLSAGVLSKALHDGQQPHAVFLQLAAVYCTVHGVPRKAVKLPHKDVIPPLFCAVCYHFLKGGTVVVLARHGTVYVLPQDFYAVLLGVVIAVVKLPIDTLLRLLVAGVSGVYHGSFHGTAPFDNSSSF